MSNDHSTFSGRRWTLTDDGVLAPRPAFFDQANCRGVDSSVFFIERGVDNTGEIVGIARAICDGCEVKDECLDHAIEANEKYGIWGGMTYTERRRLRRRRYAARKQAS